MEASVTCFVWLRGRSLNVVRCSFDNGAASSICDHMLRNCLMTASG
jgi:hypothetical protein